MNKGTVEYTQVPVKSLKLDTRNPRIAQWVEKYGYNVSDDAMKLALQKGGSDDRVAGPSYRGLQESIRTNGGVSHRLDLDKVEQRQLSRRRRDTSLDLESLASDLNSDCP